MHFYRSLDSLKRVFIVLRRKPSLGGPCFYILRVQTKFIPFLLGPTRTKSYTLFRTDSRQIMYTHCFKTERSKTIPCPAAHPRIGYIREYLLGFLRLFTVPYFSVRSSRYVASFFSWRSSWFSNVSRGRASGIIHVALGGGRHFLKNRPTPPK